MNKDINKTLMALVPILKMSSENVTNIEAVHDWYKVGDREYMKEGAPSQGPDTASSLASGHSDGLTPTHDAQSREKRLREAREHCFG